MDIGIGIVSLVPGAAIPAILAAIALQSEKIYRPMAQELAAVYLANTDDFTDRLGNIASVSTVALEFGQEFAIEFLVECAQELITEAGLGAAATFIPVVGAFAAAGLDFLIAQMLTWRVGTMTAIYFQNGAQWVDNRKSTMEIAKEMSGGLIVSFTDALEIGKSRLSSNRAPTRGPRVILDDIPARVPQVKESGMNSIIPLIKGFADKLPRAAVRESLLGMGLSAILVDAALGAYYK